LRPARDEDEVGRRGRIGDQASPLIVDQHAAIEAFADLDAAARVGAAMGAGRDLDQPGAEAHGVVAGDAARVPTAQAVREIAGRPLPGGRGLRRGLGKVTVVGREVGGQEGLGPRAGLDPAEAELGDEAVLEGGPQRSMRPLAWGECAAM